MKTVFLRANEADDKAAALLRAIRTSAIDASTNRFEVDIANFAVLPTSPFAYWVSENIINIFATNFALNHDGRVVVSTNPLNLDFRYVRAWWEPAVLNLSQKWRPWAKGGAYSPYYYPIDTVIAWDGARETYFGFLGTDNRPLARPASSQHFFRPGITWARRTQGGLSLRAMPAGCIFADKGPAAFVEGDDEQILLALLAIVNTRAFRMLVELQMAFGSYEVGVIQRTPIPNHPLSDLSYLAVLARRAWSLKRVLDTCTETSHAFVLPALLQSSDGGLLARAAAWIERVAATGTKLALIQAEIDEHCFQLYGIGEADRRAVSEGFAASAEAHREAGEGDATDDEPESAIGIGVPVLVAELVSWAVGVAFGRFDLRYATGALARPAEPEPFNRLPICSSAMLTRDDGLPCDRMPHGYPIDLPMRGILVDDAGHQRDLTMAVHSVFQEVFGNEAEARWDEATQFLAPGEHGLRRWLASDFFEHHLKRYSKSRRKAPIHWQLGVPSGLYSVWLYSHRVTHASLFELQSDIVAPKLTHEERRLIDLRLEAATDPSAAKRREVEAQERLVEELRVMLEEVGRVAPLWNPSLDDGVVLAMAPLWRLVPQHRAWQRELKSGWDDLVDAKHEWANIAIQLWPERVVPKCTTERSLAIAHGLEDVFWVEGLDRRWRPRGSINSTIRYLEDGLLSESLRATVMDLKRFARQHIATQSEAGWWMDLKSGRHDDTPLALALWPERVLQRARTQPSLLSGLGLPLPARGFDDRALAALLRRYRPRHSEVDLEVLDVFCATFGNAGAWETRWADFDIGRLDEQPLARFLYPRRVLARALTDHAFAAGHDLARWFWLNAPAGPRRLKEPEEEVKIALAERDRPAMKAALKAFLEAPVAPGSARRERRARSA